MRKINWADHFINFIAVIIGVTLAFYITARAEDKKNNAELKLYLEALKEEISYDLKEYRDYQIPTNQAQVSDIQTCARRISEPDADSLAIYFSTITDLESHDPVSNTYKSMQSSGKLSLIENFDLRKALGTYYVEESNVAVLLGDKQADYFFEQLLPHLVNEFDIVDMNDESLRNKIVLQNHLFIYSALIDDKAEKYETLKTSAEKLVKEIEEELEAF